MRLATDELKQAILHADQAVRQAIVFYFAHSFTPDATILPLVIEVIERYGRAEAFSFYTFMENLPLSDDTLPWLLSELSKGDEGVDGYFKCLLSCLLSADPAVLERHEETIMESEWLSDEDRDALAERIWFRTRSPQELWQDLEEFCETQANETDVAKVDLGFANRLVSALADYRDEFAERLLDLLRADIDDYTDNPMIWMEPLAVRLAGEMRLEATTPLIVDKLLGVNDDYLHEECQRALIRIGTDDVVESLAAKFISADSLSQFPVCHALELIHTDLSAATSLELVEHAEDTTIKALLIAAALLNFTTDAIEPARQFVLNTPLDPDVIDVRSNLLIASDVLGVDFPEREEWREARQGDQEFRRKWYAEHYGSLAGWTDDELDDELDDEYLDEMPIGSSMTIQNEQPKIGRNDPCPCGSGKKYKQCCLKKAKENPLWN